MKNISKYWLLFMIAAMSATSCSDDDNEKVVMPDPDPTTLCNTHTTQSYITNLISRRCIVICRSCGTITQANYQIISGNS